MYNYVGFHPFDCVQYTEHAFCVDQGDSTVDFILISRPLKSDPDSGTSDPPHLFSHHSCHCRQVPVPKLKI